MSLRARVRVALFGLLFLGLVVGRLASTLAPVAAALAPAVCRVCHGCGVAEHEDVCDCDACHEIDEGRAASSPSVHEPAHGALTEHHASAPDAGWGGAALTPAAPPAPLLLAPSPPPRLFPRGSDPPVVPPPERAA